MRLKKIEPICEISKRQKQALTFIAWCIQVKRISPTQKIIALALNIKGNSAWVYTEALVKKGFLKRKIKRGRRCLRLDEFAYEILNKDDFIYWEKWYEKMKQLNKDIIL
jgi:hypothetical protein